MAGNFQPPISKALDTSGEEFFLRVSSAQGNKRTSVNKKLWKPEEYRLISPKSPDPSIAKSFHRMISIQRSEDTLMRTSRRLEYKEPREIGDDELKESIVVFSKKNVMDRKGAEQVTGVQEKTGRIVSGSKPAFYPRKMTKNMRIGINRKLEYIAQPIITFNSANEAENNYREFPAKGLKQMPKVRTVNENFNTDLNKKSPSELFDLICKRSRHVKNKVTKENSLEYSPTLDMPSSSPKYGLRINTDPNESLRVPDEPRPHTTQSAKYSDTYANVPSLVGSYIRNKEKMISHSNIHSIDRKKCSPPHQRMENVEKDYKKEIFEKPFANDKVSIRNRYKIPRLLVNRKCSGRKLVSEFMDLKGLISIKDALLECNEIYKKKFYRQDFDDDEDTNFYANEAVKDLKRKIQTLYNKAIPAREPKRQHAHKSSSSSIKDYLL